MKKLGTHLFGDGITAACEYCLLGRDSSDGEMILCSRSGVVSPYYRCRKFKYSPIRRTPKPPPKLPRLNPTDFQL